MAALGDPTAYESAPLQAKKPPNQHTHPNVATVVCRKQGLAGNLCHVDCSNRGACDYQTGLCECYTGYYGYNCGLQSVLAK